jgi:tetratricopeptide (TPR) repeat protein
VRSGTGDARRRRRARVALCLLLAVVCGGGAASCARAQSTEGERHFQRGRELRQAGDLRGAKGEFEQATRALPESDNAFYLLALTLADLGEWQASAEMYRRAIALNPARAVARHGYGNVLLSLGDHEGNLREQTEAVRLEPSSAAFLIALGDAQEESGDKEGARASFEKAAALDSEPKVRATAHMRLGYLLAAEGATARAVEALRRGVELDPGDEYANRRLKELEASATTPRPTGDRAGGALSRGLVPPADDASAEDILHYLDEYGRAVVADSDSYPVPPRPWQAERIASKLEEARKATDDPGLKGRIDKALRERVPLLKEASRAFWGGGGPEKNEAKPAAGGGAGAGTGPPRPADSKP